MTQSAEKRGPDFSTVTCPENPPSKYFSIVSPIRPSMRDRNASPISMCFPDIRRLIFLLTFPVQTLDVLEFIPVAGGHKLRSGLTADF